MIRNYSNLHNIINVNNVNGTIVKPYINNIKLLLF